MEIVVVSPTLAKICTVDVPPDQLKLLCDRKAIRYNEVCGEYQMVWPDFVAYVEEAHVL